MLRASHLQLRLQRKAVLLQNGACQLLALGGKEGRLDATGLGLGAGKESEIGNEELDSRPARNSLFWSFLAVLMEVCASARAERREKSGRERKEEREGGRKR